MRGKKIILIDADIPGFASWWFWRNQQVIEFDLAQETDPQLLAVFLETVREAVIPVGIPHRVLLTKTA